MENNEMEREEINKKRQLWDESRCRFVTNPEYIRDSSILFLICGVGMLFVGGNAGSVEASLLGVLLIVAGIIMLATLKDKKDIWQKVVENEVLSRQQQKEGQERQEKIDFYNDCEAQGITSLETRASVDRLELMAKQKGIPVTGDAIVQYYNEGKAFAKQAVIDAENEVIEAKKEEEIALIYRNCRYLSYSGREKMVQMYTDLANEQHILANEYEEQASELKASADRYYDISKERERDWASVGGAVSGIAGGAAGVAAAIEVQTENAEIRARNSARLHSIASLTADGLINIWGKKHDAEERESEYLECAEKAKLKLTEEQDANDLITYLRPKAANIKKNDTGSVSFIVELEGVTNITIYDRVPAVIDGHIRAILLANGEEVGDALFSLPCSGSKRRETVQCICRDIVADNDFSVDFESIDLWAIEADD